MCARTGAGGARPRDLAGAGAVRRRLRRDQGGGGAADRGYAIDPAVTDALDRAAETLAAAGYRVEEVAPPMTEALANDALASLFGDAACF